MTGVTQVMVTPSLSDVPSQTLCPHCQQLVLSQTRDITGLLSWIICGSLAVVGCWPCCFIPLCTHCSMDVEHHCPNCKALIYVYRRL
ncbi:lipopolysaccharide-induced tumor necrosis factor-alpha factor homolog [Megalops cyprinoides]|uniref:lipopolysaccharide-induced tumor necrosis factor-alpha factor homolog n=1 Tax=Megalops cyprinoides TaxID=118141 RepID=UPI001863CBE9|nr:lipopolysaccharide-induced tumor necrosis factor-alpha factor homolog [Megalops cyprinoides]